MRKVILSCLAVFLAISFVRAQIPSMNPNNGVLPVVMNVAGGTYDNPSSYFRYEWSFGEVVLIQSMAPADSSILITHGVLQPCTDKISAPPQVVVFDAGDYRLFPNPTSDKFELDFFVNIPGQMRLQLINSVGQVLEKRDYHYDGCCRIQLFDLTRHPNGVYFVIADLKPDNSNSGQTRHSGFQVIKLRSN